MTEIKTEDESDALKTWREIETYLPKDGSWYEGRRAIRTALSLQDELVEALECIFAKLDRPHRGAPGHCHTIPGIWDNDISNGERAGKPCEWCADWERARSLLTRIRKG